MYIFLGTQDLRGKVYGEIKPSGGFWEVKQEGATNLRTGARLDSVKGCYWTFDVVFTSQSSASEFAGYCASKQQDAAIPLYIRSSDWYYLVWGVVLKPGTIGKSPMDYIQYTYEVICYLYSPYAYKAAALTWSGSNVSPPQTSAAIANSGHIGMAPYSLQVKCHYASSAHVTNLYLRNLTTLKYLYLCYYALTDEIWTLYGQDNKLTEYYSDAISSITQFTQDTTRSGTLTYSDGAILFQNAAYAIYRLSGPNPTKYPVKMMADLSLDSGGATGKAYIEVSSSASGPWTAVLDQSDFVSGVYEYTLQGTDYMTDIYVRIRNESGTSGKYLRLSSIIFSAERMIQSGTVPEVTADASEEMALCSGSTENKITFSSIWRPMRLHTN